MCGREVDGWGGDGDDFDGTWNSSATTTTMILYHGSSLIILAPNEGEALVFVCSCQPPATAQDISMCSVLTSIQTWHDRELTHVAMSTFIWLWRIKSRLAKQWVHIRREMSRCWMNNSGARGEVQQPCHPWQYDRLLRRFGEIGAIYTLIFIEHIFAEVV
jgi:hypothetical protein